MLFPGVHRHLPKSPLRKRDHTVRSELTHISTRLLTLEREQEVQFKRIAQIQHELDEIKRILEQLAGKD